MACTPQRTVSTSLSWGVGWVEGSRISYHEAEEKGKTSWSTFPAANRSTLCLGATVAPSRGGCSGRNDPATTIPEPCRWSGFPTKPSTVYEGTRKGGRMQPTFPGLSSREDVGATCVIVVVSTSLRCGTGSSPPALEGDAAGLPSPQGTNRERPAGQAAIDQFRPEDGNRVRRVDPQTNAPPLDRQDRQMNPRLDHHPLADFASQDQHLPSFRGCRCGAGGDHALGRGF